MATPTHEARLAVLIDADNASAQHLERLLVEIAKYGTATVRRAYDGWAHLGVVGSNLSRLASDFDTRTWVYAKRTDLLKAHPGYDVESRSPADGKPRASVVRRKPARARK